MKGYAEQLQNQPRTLNSKPQASKQAPIDTVLQQYKKQSIQQYAENKERFNNSQIIQRKWVDQKNKKDTDKKIIGHYQWEDEGGEKCNDGIQWYCYTNDGETYFYYYVVTDEAGSIYSKYEKTPLLYTAWEDLIREDQNAVPSLGLEIELHANTSFSITHKDYTEERFKDYIKKDGKVNEKAIKGTDNTLCRIAYSTVAVTFDTRNDYGDKEDDRLCIELVFDHKYFSLSLLQSGYVNTPNAGLVPISLFIATLIKEVNQLTYYNLTGHNPDGTELEVKPNAILLDIVEKARKLSIESESTTTQETSPLVFPTGNQEGTGIHVTAPMSLSDLGKYYTEETINELKCFYDILSPEYYNQPEKQKSLIKVLLSEMLGITDEAMQTTLSNSLIDGLQQLPIKELEALEEKERYHYQASLIEQVDEWIKNISTRPRGVFGLLSEVMSCFGDNEDDPKQGLSIMPRTSIIEIFKLLSLKEQKIVYDQLVAKFEERLDEKVSKSIEITKKEILEVMKKIINGETENIDDPLTSPQVKAENLGISALGSAIATKDGEPMPIFEFRRHVGSAAFTQDSLFQMIYSKIIDDLLSSPKPEKESGPESKIRPTIPQNFTIGTNRNTGNNCLLYALGIDETNFERIRESVIQHESDQLGYSLTTMTSFLSIDSVLPVVLQLEMVTVPVWIYNQATGVWMSWSDGLLQFNAKIEEAAENSIFISYNGINHYIGLNRLLRQ